MSSVPDPLDRRPRSPESGISGLAPGETSGAALSDDERARILVDLIHPTPSRHRSAEREMEAVWDLTWIAPLQRLYRRTEDRAAKERIVRAHRRIGMRGYRIRPRFALDTVRRSTKERRLASADRLLILLIRLGAAGERRFHGVDLELLRVATSTDLVLLDEAASDGTCSLDLLRSWNRSAAGERSLQVHAADLAPWFHELEGAPGNELRAIVDADGGLRQVRIGNRLFDASRRPQRAAIPAGIVELFEKLWDSLSEEERARSRVPWIHPEAIQLAEDDPERLILVRHDLFQPYQRRVPFIRCCGVLYRQLRKDADSQTYFGKDDIVRGVRSIGENLSLGGIALVGNVVDSLDGRRAYNDFDVWQRVSLGELRLGYTRGRGLGLGVDRLELGDAVARDREELQWS